MFKALDLKLRELWAFWDSHGTRLLGIVGFFQAAIGAVVGALGNLSSENASVWLAVSAVLGAMTRARGQVNAEKQP